MKSKKAEEYIKKHGSWRTTSFARECVELAESERDEFWKEKAVEVYCRNSSCVRTYKKCDVTTCPGLSRFTQKLEELCK